MKKKNKLKLDSILRRLFVDGLQLIFIFLLHIVVFFKKLAQKWVILVFWIKCVWNEWEIIIHSKMYTAPLYLLEEKTTIFKEMLIKEHFEHVA